MLIDSGFDYHEICERGYSPPVRLHNQKTAFAAEIAY